MKNTFGINRIFERGMHPYDATIKNKCGVYYLFEITRKTTLSEIINIESKFTDNELIFASADPKIVHYTSALDAANLDEVGGRKQRDFYIYKDGKFYKTVLDEVNYILHKHKRLKLTNEIVEIIDNDWPFKN